MPITRSAKKALRQSIRRRKKNISKKENFEKAIKNYRRAVSVGKQDEAKKLLSQVYKSLDKAAKTGVIKKGAAQRKKSRLTKLLEKRK